MDPGEAIGRSCFSIFIRRCDAKTFKRLLALALETGGPYTMAAMIFHNKETDHLFLRIQKYGIDLMLMSTRLQV